MKRSIGYGLLSLPYLALGLAIYSQGGWGAVLGVFAVSIAVLLCIIIGVELTHA